MQDSLFFIYVAKNEKWKKLYDEDWEYVSSMTRFFKYWIKHQFDENISVDADILPVITGKVFDRMSLAYLLRDHAERGESTFHFYLSYHRPIWTDCHLPGYHGNNFGYITWARPKVFSASKNANEKFFADNNCNKISHIISHELLRRKTKKRKIYFDQVHKLWDRHVDGSIPFIYYNSKFSKVSKTDEYRFATIDLTKL